MSSKIAKVEAIPISAPMDRPLKMAVATVYGRTCVVVRITTEDGLEGLGESVLTRYFTGESLASAVDLIESEYIPQLVGRRPEDYKELRALMRRISVYNNGARAAVEMALVDLVAKHNGIPLYEWYGGKKRDAVPTIWHVSGADADEMATEAAKAVAEGHPLVKVKVGKNVEADLEATYAVRQAIGDDVLLLPDANQGWSVPDALRYTDGVVDANPGFVEQPVPRWDIVGMRTVTQSSHVLIAGDEGIFDADDLETYLELGAANAVVAKLMKSAGPIGVKRLFEVADANDVGVHFAGMAGQTSISAAHGAHLALAVPNLRFGSGISPQYLTEDIATERFLPVGGHLHPSHAPGVGIEIDEDMLEKFRVDL